MTTLTSKWSIMKPNFRNIWHSWSFSPWNTFSNWPPGYRTLLVIFLTCWLLHLSPLLDHPLAYFYMLEHSRALFSASLLSPNSLLRYLIQFLGFKLYIMLVTLKVSDSKNTPTTLYWFLHSLTQLSTQHLHLNVQQESPTCTDLTLNPLCVEISSHLDFPISKRHHHQFKPLKLKFKDITFYVT